MWWGGVVRSVVRGVVKTLGCGKECGEGCGEYTRMDVSSLTKGKISYLNMNGFFYQSLPS